MRHTIRFPVLLIGLFIGLAWWRRRRQQRPCLFARPNTPLYKILLKCASLQSYMPTPYLLGGLLQSVAPDALLKAPKLALKREVLRLSAKERPEGLSCAPKLIPEGEVSLDWAMPNKTCVKINASAPVVLLVPGLTSDSRAGYIARCMNALTAAGFRAVCFNPRGRGGNAVLSSMLYCAGYTEDLRRVVTHIRNTACLPTGAALVCVGYSLGSNYLAKMMGEDGEECLVDASVCVSCPVDLISVSNHFSHSWMGRWFVDPALVKLVQNVRVEWEGVLSQHPSIEMSSVRTATTMHEFDHHAIAPQFDCANEGEYYRTASAGLWLPRVRKPILFLHAANDPLIPGRILRPLDFTTSNFVADVISAEGGHSMDFLEGWSMQSWSANVICEFVRAVQLSMSDDLS